ncbi:MAG: hypothetical protein QM765_51235 [Myxococcales bacterium]
MARRSYVPMIIALVAACSSGGGTKRTDAGVNWGDRDGMWGACWYPDKEQCADYPYPEDGFSAEKQQSCRENDGLWGGSCPLNERGSCEFTAANMILRFYNVNDLQAARMACQYGGTWINP